MVKLRKIGVLISVFLFVGMSFGVMVDNARGDPPNVRISDEVLFYDIFSIWDPTKWTCTKDPSPPNLCERSGDHPSEVQWSSWFLDTGGNLHILSPEISNGIAKAESAPYSQTLDYVIRFQFLLDDDANSKFKVVDDGYVLLTIEDNRDLYAFDGLTYTFLETLEREVWHLIEIRVHVSTHDYDVYIGRVHRGNYNFASTPKGRLLFGDDEYSAGYYGEGYWDDVVVALLHQQPWDDYFDGGNIADWSVITSEDSIFEVTPSPHSLRMFEVGAVAYGFTPFYDMPSNHDYEILFQFKISNDFALDATVVADGNLRIILDGDELKAYISDTTIVSIAQLTVGFWHSIEVYVEPALEQYWVTIDTVKSPNPFPFIQEDEFVFVKSPSQLLMGDHELASTGAEAYWDDVVVKSAFLSGEGVKINEVMFDPITDEQWVELHNTGYSPVNIDGWEITDEDNNVYTIPTAVPDMPSGSYVVIHFRSGVDDTFFGQTQPNALHLFAGERWIKHHVDPNFPYPRVVKLADFDDDGDLDVVSGTRAVIGPYGWWDISWWEHPDNPTSTWIKHTIEWSNNPAQGLPPFAIDVGDIDSDGDIDFVAVSWDAGYRIAWYENDLNNPTSPGWIKHLIEQTSDPGFLDVALADINLDTHLDIVFTHNGYNFELDWYRSDGTPRDGGWTKYTIMDDGGRISVGDIDGDDDPDIVVDRVDGHNLVWAENEGSPEDWTYHDLDGKSGPGHGAFPYTYIADIDDDGDMDIVRGTLNDHPMIDDDVAWYENVLDDPVNPRWEEHIIDDSPEGLGHLYISVADIDNDGNPDLVGTTIIDKYVLWYEAPDDPTAGMWMKHYIDTNLYYCKENDVGDIDDDNLLDVVVGGRVTSELPWYTRRIFDKVDQVSLYSGSTHDITTIVDFVAWGGDAGADDDIAVAAGIWTDGDYVDTSTLLKGQSIGRDKYSTDTDSSTDWSIQTSSQGEQNPYP